MADHTPHALGLPLDALLRDLGTSPAGLSDEEARSRRARYGTNELQAPVRRALALQILGP